VTCLQKKTTKPNKKPPAKSKSPGCIVSSTCSFQ